MTKHHPHFATRVIRNHHDYLPAAGHDALLPFYDLIARLYGMPEVYATLLGQADIAEGHRVLDIGCGTGNLSLRVKRAHPAAEVIGSDPDPRALARARRKARGLSAIRFDQAYVQELPYRDREFDRVVSSMMWHHVDPEVKAAAAAEILRVMRPGGRLHLVDVAGAITAAEGRRARRFLRSAHLADNLGEGIPNLLRGAGFECSEVTSQVHRRVGRLTYYRATRTT